MPDATRPEAKRVRDQAGAEFTTYVVRPGWTVLDKEDALDADGKALPARPADRKKAGTVKTRANTEGA